jgi:hypothetical protein
MGKLAGRPVGAEFAETFRNFDAGAGLLSMAGILA